MCGRFFCFLLFFIHHWKNRCFSGCTQNEELEQEKGAVENKKVVVHKNIKYSIKIYRTD